MFNKKNNNKGFTLMEMLIVVAIIAILIAIAIPTFSNTLEKSRESTDAANIRAAYSEAASVAVTENKTVTRSAKVTQTDVSKWEGDVGNTLIGDGDGTTNKLSSVAGTMKTGKYITVKVSADGSVVLGTSDTEVKTAS